MVVKYSCAGGELNRSDSSPLFQLFDILDLVLKDQNGTKYCINTSQIQITFYFDYCVSVSTFIFAPCVNKKGGSFCNLIYVF